MCGRLCWAGEDGNLCVVGCVWLVTPVKSGDVNLSVAGCAGQVTSLTSSADGNLCVVGCRDSKVYVYDIPSARLLRTLTKHGSPVLAALFTSQGTLLITAGQLGQGTSVHHREERTLINQRGEFFVVYRKISA